MNNQKINYYELIKETTILTVAIAIIASAVYLFLVPSQTSISSISGLAIIISHYIPLSLSMITMILNIVLLIIGFILCGKEFGIKTFYTSILLPIFIGIYEIMLPNYHSITNSQELDVICYVLLVSIGLAILFNRNASSGGLDIVAKIMNKYLYIDLGKAMFLSGMCVALMSALIYDEKAVVLSVLGTYFNGIVLDLDTLHSGATIYEAIGAYNLEKRNEIITIVDNNEYQKLMNYLNHEDPEAFVTIYTVSNMRYQPKKI